MYFSHQIINIIQFKCKFSSMFTNVFLIYFFNQSYSHICVIKKMQHHPAWKTTIWWLVRDCAIDNGIIHIMSAIWTVTFLYFVDFLTWKWLPILSIYPRNQNIPWHWRVSIFAQMYLYSKPEYAMRRKVIFYFSHIWKKLLTSKCNRNNTDKEILRRKKININAVFNNIHVK